MGIFDFLKPKQATNVIDYLISKSDFDISKKEKKAQYVGMMVPEVTLHEYDMLLQSLKDQDIKVSLNKSIFIKEFSVTHILYTNIYLHNRIGKSKRDYYMQIIEESYYQSMARIFMEHENIVNELQYILSEQEKLANNAIDEDKLLGLILHRVFALKMSTSENYPFVRYPYSSILMQHRMVFNNSMLSKLD